MDYKMLTNTKLFQGISVDEAQRMLACLGSQTRAYKKGSYIYHAGDVIHSLGIVLSGNIIIEQTDVWGRQTIFDTLSTGYIFAETYACIGTEPLAVDVVVAKDSEVLFLETKKIMTPCSNSCSFHSRILHNLLSVVASKNLMLTRKMSMVTQRSIRERLLTYLSSQASLHGSSEFDIPFNRQQLADFLCVDRSALSNELSKMQRDGLITFCKGHFLLHTI